jgi:DNA-binding transcriptional regulator PaaX
VGVPRKNFFTSLILEALDLDIPLLPLESVYDFAKRKGLVGRRKYRDSIKGLRNRGVIEIVKKNSQEFLKLTKKGALRVLLEKAKVVKHLPWDGKWRVLIFDIPEDFNVARDRFRKLLKQNGFVKLQASVFISPHPLSREAIGYLGEVGLIKFVRIMKVEEMDYDKDIKKKFGL